MSLGGYIIEGFLVIKGVREEEGKREIFWKIMVYENKLNFFLMKG